MLADEYQKRVVIVDTSNEIAGDGDIPHAGIGMARRMQVPKVDLQHKVDRLFSSFSCFFSVDFFLLLLSFLMCVLYHCLNVLVGYD